MKNEKEIEKNTGKTINVRKIDEELKDLIQLFGDYAKDLRELLNTEIEKPFTIDKMLELKIEFDEPYKLNEFFAKEIFNSTHVYITGIHIIDSVIQFWIRDSKGNTGNEKVYLGEKLKTIKAWEYYLIALVSPILPIHVEQKRTDLALFYSELKDLLDSVKE
jgi:hypothetical protein